MEGMDERLDRDLTPDEVYDLAWELWGQTMQLIMYIEEHGEAIVATCHLLRGRIGIEKFLEETEDSGIMNDQVRRELPGITEEMVLQLRIDKLKRLESRVKEALLEREFKRRGIEYTKVDAHA